MEKSTYRLNEDDVRGFTNLLEPVVPKVKESDFIRFFLPLFAVKDPKNPVDISMWLDVAGHPHAPVDVVDTTGKVLFRVPPLLQDVDFVDFPAGHSLYDVVKSAQEQSRIHPRFGIEIMEKGLANRLEIPKSRLETIAQFNSIFERYGVEKIELPKGVVDASSSKPQPSGDTATEFEDF